MCRDWHWTQELWYHGKEGEGRPGHYHVGVHGLPRAELRDAEEPAQRSRAVGAPKILSAVPPSSGASRDAVSRVRPGQYRVVAQVAEQRSPKPQVGGSSPSGPAEAPSSFSPRPDRAEGAEQGCSPLLSVPEFGAVGQRRGWSR